ncbi:hypothetical protein EYF80_047090 [Liparis tanakae]|uniref:Uncharacterized protein n=1 Tax=Liparis tanakae TaxID=230148 RepID=A0A4Z2FPD6_9TELE|nr:hypothetical protein EYF80_047090 [Liparis tanakae]
MKTASSCREEEKEEEEEKHALRTHEWMFLNLHFYKDRPGLVSDQLLLDSSLKFLSGSGREKLSFCFKVLPLSLSAFLLRAPGADMGFIMVLTAELLARPPALWGELSRNESSFSGSAVEKGTSTPAPSSAPSLSAPFLPGVKGVSSKPPPSTVSSSSGSSGSLRDFLGLGRLMSRLFSASLS